MSRPSAGKSVVETARVKQTSVVEVQSRAALIWAWFVCAYAVAVSSANAAHTLTRSIRGRLLISISLFDARVRAR
jgi:hypothetical protein